MAGEFGVEIPGHTLLSRLGKGGMASVYLGRHNRLGRLVAIKVIDDRFEFDPHFRARFEREARTAAGLSHPHIVPVHEYGVTDDGRAYITMAFLDGGSLRDKLRQRGSIAVDEALGITRQVASALLAAHARNVVHRDLKPDNVMFQGETALLTDFGIAKVLDAATELTGTGTNPGTVKYFSPEQALELPIDQRSDIYTLGVVLYEMLTARGPIEGNTVAGLVMGIAHRPPDPLPEALRGLQPFMDMLLAKDPAQRLGSCADVVAVIDAMLKNLTRHGDMQRITDGVVLTPSGQQPARANQDDTLPLGAAATPAALMDRPSAAVPPPTPAGNVDRSSPGVTAPTLPIAKAPSGAAAVAMPQAGFRQGVDVRSTPNDSVARDEDSGQSAIGAARPPQRGRWPWVVGLAATLTLVAGAAFLVLEHGFEDPSVYVTFSDRLADGSTGPLMSVRDDESARSVRRWLSIIDTPAAFAVNEVTFEEFDRFTDAKKLPRPADAWGRGRHPVVNVTRDDARAYADWLTLLTGKIYRLPTSKEWQLLANYDRRRCSARWYERPLSQIFGVAGCEDPYGTELRQQSQVFESLGPANSVGLVAMMGSIWEITDDCPQRRNNRVFRSLLLRGSPSPADTDGCATGAALGGSWAESASGPDSRLDWSDSDKNDRVGFRLVREMKGTETVWMGSVIDGESTSAD